jgi:hypothetical protein
MTMLPSVLPRLRILTLCCVIAPHLVVPWASAQENDLQDKPKPTPKRILTPPPTNPPLVEADASALPEQTQRLDLYLLMGQSNMKGRGVMSDLPVKDLRIINMHLKTGDWYLARHPLHLIGDPRTFKHHDNAGVGPGLTFAQQLAVSDPTARIGLVPCAVGGSAISRWTKGKPLYERAVKRAKAALAAGPKHKTSLGGVLWLQGEADARAGRIEVYPQLLCGMIDDLRADLGIDDLPVVACTIGEFREPAEIQKRMNRILLDLPNQTPNTACVDARDLKSHLGDHVHFDTQAQEEIGRRFANELTRLKTTEN